MKIDTICVHGNNNVTNKSINPAGAVSVPIYQSATFVHPGVNESTGYDYTRVQNPTRQQLEQVVAKLENGFDALAFTSGMAATTTVMELFSIGDHIIATDDLYGGSLRLFNNISKKNGIEVDYVNTADIEQLQKLIKHTTKAIFIETPSNPLMQVTDIIKLSQIAKQHNLLLIVDNTFLTPILQKPLELGADIVIHSATKYLAGHNDTLAGFVVVKTEELAEKIRYIYKTTGACLAPFDSWLVLRGIKTLAIRMEKQQANAKVLANWLQQHPKVTKVYYAGIGAMLSFRVESEAIARQVLERVNLVLYAESLGGVETLITYPMLQTHADIPEEIRRQKGIDEELLRLSVGIEATEDIIVDLSQALG